MENRKQTNPKEMKKTIFPLLLTTVVTLSLNDASAHRVFGLGGSRLAEIDTDGDGTISDEEREAARAAREEARQAFIDEFDEDGDGVLNEEEREAAKAAREAEREAAKTERYHEIDGDADGEVTVEELQAAMPEVDPERVAKVLARLDEDESGTVSLDEFLNASPRGRGQAGPGGQRGPKAGHRPPRRPGRAIRIRGGIGGRVARAIGGAPDGGGEELQ